MSTPFFKKLRREATASPKKAALLGLLLLVAVYFWAPLLRQWTSSSDNAAEPPTATAPQPPVAPPAAASPPVAATAPANPPNIGAAPPAPPKFHWRQLAQGIEGDPRMQPVQPAATPGAQRDPFVDPQPPSPPAQVAAVPKAPREVEATPDELGLVLSSTIVGPARRTAVVNGKVYIPGRELEAGQGLVFVVRRIEPWGIVLERAGKQFELELPRPSLPGR